MLRIVVVSFLVTLIISCNTSQNEKILVNSDPNIKDSLFLDSLNRVIEKSPSDSKTFALRADYFLSKGQLLKGTNYLNRANILDSLNPAYYVMLADLYLQLGESDKTHHLLHKANRLIPQNSVILSRLGNLYLYVKDYEKAMGFYKQGEIADNNNPDIFFGKGILYAEKGDTTKAIQQLLTAIERNPSFVNAYNFLGHLHALKNDSLAVSYYNNALLYAPSNYEAYYGIAMFYQNHFYVDEAIKMYQKMLNAVSVQLPEIYYNIAYNYMIFLDDYHKAIAYYDTAITYQNDYPEAYSNRGYCYEQLKDYAKSRENYLIAIKQKPNFDPAVLGLNRLDKLGK